jgi:hypothetical protein
MKGAYMTRIALKTDYDYADDTRYYTDGDKVYFAEHGFGAKEIRKADLETSELFIGWFAKDKNHCYFNGSVFKKADVKTFEVINWPFAKDKNNVYTNKGILKDADPQTFEAMGDGYYRNPAFGTISPIGYGKDTNHVYFYNHDSGTFKLKDADAKTFVYVAGRYGKDKNYVFCGGCKLKNANPETWKLLDGYYSKDDNNAYYLSEPMNIHQVRSEGQFKRLSRSEYKGVDIETFEVFTYNGDLFAKDKNYIYNDFYKMAVSTDDRFFDSDEVKDFLKIYNPVCNCIIIDEGGTRLIEKLKYNK